MAKSIPNPIPYKELYLQEKFYMARQNAEKLSAYDWLVQHSTVLPECTTINGVPNKTTNNK